MRKEPISGIRHLSDEQLDVLVHQSSSIDSYFIHELDGEVRVSNLVQIEFEQLLERRHDDLVSAYCYR